jgi:eukaryotic-like serine/threonine-protein kinase
MKGFTKAIRSAPAKIKFVWYLILILSVTPLIDRVFANSTSELPKTPTESSWPMFRGGPGLLGVAPGSLAQEIELLWTFKTEGPIKSSAAIQENRVFIGSDDGHLYALNFADGKKIWSHKTEGPIESSPLVLDGKVYFGSSDGFLYAIEAASGDLIWKFETEDRILGSPNWVAAPDGEGVWILIGSYDYKLYCLDAATGQKQWSYETDNYINGTPAVANGTTLFGGCDALLHVISLKDGSKVKEIEAGAYIAGSGAVDNQQMFIGHYGNEFLRFDIDQGKMVWSYKDRAFPYFSSPAVGSDRVVFGGRDRRLHCVQRSDGERIWVFNTRGRVDSSPVICDGKVVVGSHDGRVYMVSLESGEELWNYEIGEAVTSSPAVASGRIVVGSEDGSIYAFGPQDSSNP